MDAAFLLVASVDGAPLRSEYSGLTGSASGTGLEFSHPSHLVRHDRRSVVSLGLWCERGEERRTWCESPERVTALLGTVYRLGDVALGDDRPAVIKQARDPASFEAVCGELHGVFAAATVDANGNGLILADPLGLRCVYYGRNSEVIAVSSRARLVADALSVGGLPVTRDRISATWQAFISYHVGDATGYEGVRVLAPGSVVTIESGSASITYRPAPWLPTDEVRTRSFDQKVEELRADVASTLTAALDTAAARHVVRLTGGKDSRLVLAIAVDAGVAQEFEYETIGPPNLADVRIAAELCEMFELRHEVKFFGLRPEKPYRDRAFDFVEATAGMVNIWDLQSPPRGAGDLYVTGLCGEILHSYRKVEPPPADEVALVRLFAKLHLNRLELVRDDAADEIHRRLVDDLLDDPDGGAEPFDLLQTHYVKNRMRFSRLGPREELSGEHLVHPLYSISTTRAAYSLDPRDRQSKVLVAEAMHRCSPKLFSHRFDSGSWDERVNARLRTSDRDAGRSDREESNHAVPDASKPPRAELNGGGDRSEDSRSLMVRLHGQLADERMELMRDLVSEHANPAWDVIDNHAVASALDRYEQLRHAERRALFGAFTAAIWLGGHASER